MKNVSPYYKALVGFVGAAVVAFLGAQDGGVTGQEWVQILLAGLAGAVGVYAVPNKTKATNERGAVDVVGVLLVVFLVLVILFLVGALR